MKDLSFLNPYLLAKEGVPNQCNSSNRAALG